MGSEDKLGFGGQHIHNTKFEINNKDLYNTGNYIQYLVTTYSGEESDKSN